WPHPPDGGHAASIAERLDGARQLGQTAVKEALNRLMGRLHPELSDQADVDEVLRHRSKPAVQARADVHLAEPLDPGGTAVSRDQTEPPGPADWQVEAERARHRGAQAVGGDDEASPQASLAVLAEGADPD